MVKKELVHLSSFEKIRMTKMISALSLKEKLQQQPNIRVIDIRENYEFDICSFVKTNIPMYQVVDALKDVSKDEEIVLVCKSGARASALANILTTENKFNNILVLEGGITSWIEEVDNTLEKY